MEDAEDTGYEEASSGKGYSNFGGKGNQRFETRGDVAKAGRRL